MPNPPVWSTSPWIFSMASSGVPMTAAPSTPKPFERQRSMAASGEVLKASFRPPTPSM